VICCLPGHAETTAGLSFDKAGITVLGFGNARNRPTFTHDTTADDLFEIDAENVRLINIRLVGAASCTALINLSEDDASNFIAEKCSFEHGAAPTMAITVEDDVDRWEIRNCTFLGTADGPDCCVSFEGQSFNWVLMGHMQLCDLRPRCCGSSVRRLHGVRWKVHELCLHRNLDAAR
jgi:hypothetical protein